MQPRGLIRVHCKGRNTKKLLQRSTRIVQNKKQLNTGRISKVSLIQLKNLNVYKAGMNLYNVTVYIYLYIYLYILTYRLYKVLSFQAGQGQPNTYVTFSYSTLMVSKRKNKHYLHIYAIINMSSNSFLKYITTDIGHPKQKHKSVIPCEALNEPYWWNIKSV